MHLSRVWVPASQAKIVSLLKEDIHAGHEIVTQGLQPNEPRYLFRTEQGNDDYPFRLLVQTHLKPDWSKLEAKGYRCETKEFSLAFKAGQWFRFAARLNCCNEVRVHDPKKGRDIIRRVGIG